MKKLLTPLLIIFFMSSSILALGQNEGIDTATTINSFEAVGEFYKMDYSGDYGDMLDDMDDQFTGGGSESFDTFKCSLFSAFGDEELSLLGRNFDNPDNEVLFTRFSPPDGYQSMAFTRMNDLGFEFGTDFSDLTFDEKIPLLLSAYFVPDGINEHGLTAGLASVQPVQFTIDPEKDTIFITRLIREILDHAQTVEEAAAIANSYNVFDNNIHILSHHLLVGTPDGESAVLEYQNGVFQSIQTDENWQVVTNIPVFEVPHEQLMSTCWRYNSLYSNLEACDAILSWDEGMDALEDVHMNCPWSAVYDMTNLGIYIAIMNNYEDITWLDLTDFEAMVYVGTKNTHPDESNIQLKNFPNPFSKSTTIQFTNPTSSYVVLSIFDQHGSKVRTLVNDELFAGMHTVHWDAKNESGFRLSSGVYFYTISCEVGTQTQKLLLMLD